MSTRLRLPDGDGTSTPPPFEPFEEEAIVSIALDAPDYFMGVQHLMNPELFGTPHVRYVMAELLLHAEKYQCLPTREGLWHQLSKSLTTDHSHWERIDAVVKRPADPRDLPAVKEALTEWARRKSFGLLYSEEAQEAYARGEYDRLEEIVNSANRITDSRANLFWLYEQFEELFEPDSMPHMSTGFPKLDKLLNNGGPGPKEVVCWMAPTGVGKSIALCQNAVYQTQAGVNTLLVTFEMDKMKVAARCLGSLSGVALNNFVEHQDMVVNRTRRAYQSAGADLVIAELPPDECSVNDIYAVLAHLKRARGWTPKCVVIDYLELMMGRRPADNKDDYTRQKSVANQVRGLAKAQDVLVFTATQTNRSGNNTDELIDLNKIAESYGKSMSLDYIISLNQTEDQRRNGQLNMFVIKNRNGPKHETILCDVNYKTMSLREKPF